MQLLCNAALPLLLRSLMSPAQGETSFRKENTLQAKAAATGISSLLGPFYWTAKAARKAHHQRLAAKEQLTIS